jgi:hypothetical protein
MNGPQRHAALKDLLSLFSVVSVVNTLLLNSRAEFSYNTPILGVASYD